MLTRICKPKNTVRYHVTPVRMTIIKTKQKQKKNQRCQQGCRETRTFAHCWWECKMAQMENRKFLKKLKIELLCDPAIPLLGLHP